MTNDSIHAKMKEKIAALPNGGVLIAGECEVYRMTFGEGRHFASGRWYDLDPLQGSRPLKVGASLCSSTYL
jgi:hypothetical protein